MKAGNANDTAITSRVLLQRAQGLGKKRILAVYDFIGHGYSYDVTFFLVMAERYRKSQECEYIDVAYIAHASDPSSPSSPYVSSGNFKLYIHNIMFEVTRLLPSIRSILFFDNRSRFDEYQERCGQDYVLFPENYMRQVNENLEDSFVPLVAIWSREMEKAAMLGEDVLCFTAPEEQTALARRWIMEHVFPKIPVTITLREAENRSAVNSAIEEWQKLVDHFRDSEVVFIVLRDYYKVFEKPVIIGDNVCYFDAPVVCLSLRAALYQESALNLFVPNGCSSLVWFNKQCNFIYFSKTATGLLRDGGFQTAPYRKMILGPDEASSLINHTESILTKMEGDGLLTPQYYSDSSINDYRKKVASSLAAMDEGGRLRYLHLYNSAYLQKRISAFLPEWREGHKRILLYGGGAHTTTLLESTDLDQMEIVGIVDRNPESHGQILLGHRIDSPEQIQSLSPDIIVISSNAYQDEIYDNLLDMQLTGVELVKLYSVDEDGGG